MSFCSVRIDKSISSVVIILSNETFYQLDVNSYLLSTTINYILLSWLFMVYQNKMHTLFTVFTNVFMMQMHTAEQLELHLYMRSSKMTIQYIFVWKLKLQNWLQDLWFKILLLFITTLRNYIFYITGSVTMCVCVCMHESACVCACVRVCECMCACA